MKRHDTGDPSEAKPYSQRRGYTWPTRRMNADKKWPNFARLVAVYVQGFHSQMAKAFMNRGYTTTDENGASSG
jgi:hypothetical protein